MNKLFSKKQGFTLIELLVTIAIIALLTGIVVTNATSSRMKARDAKRISDLGQLQFAIELYFDRCKQYPGPGPTWPATHGTVTLLTTLNNGCPSGIELGSYISRIPSGNYIYQVNNLSKPTTYVLHTLLEGVNDDIIKDSLPSNPINSPPGCTNAAGTKDYCIGPQ